MLRMYCVANWFNLADEACENAMYDMVDQRKPLASTRGYRKAQILSKPVNNDDLFIHSPAHHTSEKYCRTSPIVGSSNATRFSLTARVFPCLVCQAEAQRALKQPTPGTWP